MAGKIAKLAAGVLMTHYRRSKVDVELLAEVARRCAAPPPVVEAATATATARHFAEACVAAGHFESLAELCRRAAGACEAFVEGRRDGRSHHGGLRRRGGLGPWLIRGSPAGSVTMIGVHGGRWFGSAAGEALRRATVVLGAPRHLASLPARPARNPGGSRRSPQRGR